MDLSSHPFSVRAMYGTVSLIAVTMSMSSNEDDWRKLKQPIMNVMDGITPFHKILRSYLLALPFVFRAFSYNSFLPNLDEPIELRTVHPAPPARTKVHGKIFVFADVAESISDKPEGKYDQEYFECLYRGTGYGTLMKPNANPWNQKAEGYLKICREGGKISSGKSLLHGDNLNGRGLHAFAFNPARTISPIRNNRSIARDVYFLARGKGGIGLPREGFPWASVMPPWEQHLTTMRFGRSFSSNIWHRDIIQGLGEHAYSRVKGYTYRRLSSMRQLGNPAVALG